MLGATLLIHGVRTRPELNGKICRLIGPHDDTRLEVQVEGERIAIKCSNLTYQGPGRSRQNLADMILPMEWGDCTEAAFLQPFIKDSYIRDPEQFEGDMYDYLFNKVRTVVNTVKKPGQAGWAFRMASPSDVVRCLVWADGSKSQETPLTSQPQYGEQWWPCIVLKDPIEPDKYPFYCPALAWVHGRPWLVHFSRLRWSQPPASPPSSSSSSSSASSQSPSTDALPPKYTTYSTVVIDDLGVLGGEWMVVD